MIVVHGGAGLVTPDRQERLRAGVRAAVATAHGLLARGASALDAAVAAVRTLEDDPEMAAGIGSALTREGTVDGTFTRDGKVLAALGESGELLVGGQAADPPIRIDPDGDVFLDGDLMMTIGDDGKISTVDKDGAITDERQLRAAQRLVLSLSKGRGA